MTLNENTKVLLGFDHGFSSIKVCIGGAGGSFKIDNSITEVADGGEILNLSGITKQSKVYSFEGKKYLVGSDITDSTNITHSRDIKYLIKYAPIFLAAAIDILKARYGIPKENIIGVASGLPLADVDSFKNEYRQRLKSFEVNGIKYSFDKVYVWPQGVGGYADYYYGWGAENPHKSQEKGFVWDIGENTLIVVHFNGSSLKKEGTKQINRGGISGIYDLIRDKVSASIGREPNIVNFRGIMTGEPIKVYGESVDCSDIVRDGVNRYLENTYTSIMESYRDKFVVSDSVILVGGGAYLLEKYIKDTDFSKSHFFKLAPQPEYSNCRGYRFLSTRG